MNITKREEIFMQMAVEESLKGSTAGHGGPFGCIIVQGDTVIAAGHNQVLAQNDPTAHAEVVAIREACRKLGSFQLDGCEIYCSCEPCPMCFGAIYWARPQKIYYANTRYDAADIGFDDQFIYDQLAVPKAEQQIPIIHIELQEAKKAFEAWMDNPRKTAY